MASLWSFGFLICFLILESFGRNLEISTVELSGSGCNDIVDRSVGDYDLIQVSHVPRFNTIGTQDFCSVTFRAVKGRRLKYSIDSLKFYECGIDVNIYEDPRSTNNPKHMLRCSSDPKFPIRSQTAYNVLTLTVRLINPTTTNYDFKMRIMNDMDVALDDFPTGKTFDNIDDRKYQGEALDPGIIAGIGIAGAIIIVALILLAIYLCVRARQTQYKDDRASNTRGESSVYTSGNSQVLFSNKERSPRGRYGSMEDIHSTASQEKAGFNGAYTNPAYSAGPREAKSERSSSLRRKAGSQNSGYEQDDVRRGTTYDSWQEDDVRIGSFRRAYGNDEADVRMGSHRRSRRDEFQNEKKQLKSALKKPTSLEMSKVNTQPNGILKAPRATSPNRSQTSSTEGSFDKNAMIFGYSHTTSKTEHPNVRHKPVIERRRSRSGTRSNRSASSAGSHSRRAHSADRNKPKPPKGGRMYSDNVFIDDQKPRSSSRNRARSSSAGRRRARGSDSVDSESSATSSRRVNMNPGGKRVHIKGEETDI